MHGFKNGNVKHIISAKVNLRHGEIKKGIELDCVGQFNSLE